MPPRSSAPRPMSARIDPITAITTRPAVHPERGSAGGMGGVSVMSLTACSRLLSSALRRATLLVGSHRDATHASCSSGLCVEVVVNEPDADRSFARSGRDSLDRTLPDVADREDAWHCRLEHDGRAFAVGVDVALAVSTRRDVAPGVTLD